MFKSLVGPTPSRIRLVLDVMRLIIRQVARHAIDLCTVLGGHTIGVLVVGMHGRVALEPGTFLFKDVPFNPFCVMIDLVEDPIGTDGHPRTIRTLQQALFANDLFCRIVFWLRLVQLILKCECGVRFVIGAPMRRFIATKRNPDFFNEHLIGRALRIESKSRAELGCRNAIFASLEPQFRALRRFHFGEGLRRRSCDGCILLLRRTLLGRPKEDSIVGIGRLCIAIRLGLDIFDVHKRSPGL